MSPFGSRLIRLLLDHYRPHRISRRTFLRRFALAAAAAGTGPALLSAKPSAAPATASDLVTLGKSGITTTRLALGSGSNGWAGSSNQTRKLGVSGYADLLQAGFERGVRFWDSADQYGSHPHLREALKRVPRDKVTILTKTRANTAEAARADIERFRRELGTDTIDILLLHCLTDPDWRRSMRPVMDVLAEAKSAGRIRAHGVSCHSIGALEAVADEPWVDIDLARINPAGRSMDAPVERVLPVLNRIHAAGKGMIGMKIFGAGALVGNRPECLRFVLRLPSIHAFTLGIENLEQLESAVGEIAEAGAVPQPA